jgi:hypothetical protein
MDEMSVQLDDGTDWMDEMSVRMDDHKIIIKIENT